jgi:hypothetical protein
VGVTVNDGEGGATNNSISVAVNAVTPTPTPTPAPTPTPTPTSAPVPSTAPAYGSIDITSSPSGAKIYIDGVDTTNITPYTITHKPAGSYVVKLEYPFYKWRIESKTVIGGETTYVSWALAAATPMAVILQPNAADGKDAYVNESASGSNYGTAENLSVANASTGGGRTRIYIQFNLSSIPSTAVIQSADLSLYYHDNESAAVNGPVGVYRVTGVWVETPDIIWSSQPAVGTLPLTTVTVSAGTFGWIVWSVNSLVQDWVKVPVVNYGVMLRDTDETASRGYKLFYSSDWATDATQRPKLEINYYDPAAP